MSISPTYSLTSRKRWDGRAESIGDAVFRLGDEITRFRKFTTAILYHVVRLQWLSRPAVRYVLIRQIYFTGIQGLPWVLAMALLAGSTAVYSVVPFSRQLNDPSLIGTLLNSLLIQEIAPMIVAIFILTRSGVAVATEIAHMHLRGEDTVLGSMGISSVEYLFLPRFIAFGLCGLTLTLLFAGASIWLGGLLLTWTHEMDFTQFLLEINHSASLDGLLLLVAKGLLYPLLSCTMLLFQGAQAGNNPNQIPVHTTRGVLWGLMLVVFTDVFIALLGRLL